ncbi:helix-turn-helix transcriptional regulator [Arthrobacter sp. CAU 1506]|uniref:ArsR/SmtB family transcription factor n=1 Tax=Arthrobacter sp. CAU 1506 TaxID=2560052 RepID=UPI0010AC6EFE|nr:helix-turn-helix domain-containing protein [Arthrobacter sp. CAU 1506]TJY71412.1 helix-turn-helix transcriptional regulator [Arthrobacter sp. CAU 1506]
MEQDRKHQAAPASDHSDRRVDVVSLKALAHPLRIQLLNVLSQYGPHTASGLAERLGESSGSTSYHLRQLAKHDFVREVEGRGTARERWWRRTPGSLTINTGDLGDSPATKEAARLVTREFERSRADLLADFMAYGSDLVPEEWLEASVVSTINVRLTREQLADLAEQASDYVRNLAAPYLDQTAESTAGTRPVQLHFNAFPILDVRSDRTPAHTESPS